jgi:hypothetical protein
MRATTITQRRNVEKSFCINNLIRNIKFFPRFRDNKFSVNLNRDSFDPEYF